MVDNKCSMKLVGRIQERKMSKTTHVNISTEKKNLVLLFKGIFVLYQIEQEKNI